MADDRQLGSVATGLLGTVWGKVVAILAAISLIIGIALEVQSFVTGNYALQKTASEARIQAIEAKNKNATGDRPMPQVNTPARGFFAVDKTAYH